jgi:hypothetical protein
MNHGRYQRVAGADVGARTKQPLPIASGEDRLRAKVTVGFEIARVSRSGGGKREVQSFTCKKPASASSHWPRHSRQPN